MTIKKNNKKSTTTNTNNNRKMSITPNNNITNNNRKMSITPNNKTTNKKNNNNITNKKNNITNNNVTNKKNNITNNNVTNKKNNNNNNNNNNIANKNDVTNRRDNVTNRRDDITNRKDDVTNNNNAITKTRIIKKVDTNRGDDVTNADVNKRNNIFNKTANKRNNIFDNNNNNNLNVNVNVKVKGNNDDDDNDEKYSNMGVKDSEWDWLIFLLYNYFIKLFNSYLKNRWLFLYIAIFIVIISFSLSFFSLWFEWLFAFIFLIFWIIKEIILWLYTIIPISFNFNMGLNNNNLILYNIFIILEIIIKIFFFVLIILFAKNYFNKKVIKWNWIVKNVDNWKSLKDILIKFLEWRTNHLKVLDIGIEILLKYYIPIIWTLLWFLSLYFLLVVHNVNVIYYDNNNNNKVIKYLIKKDNNIEVIKAISKLKLNLNDNNLKKLEQQWTNWNKIENILLYYATKNKNYIKEYKNDKNYYNIKNISSYPPIVYKTFNKLEDDLKSNNYSTIYTPFILTKIMIISAYFNWKTLNNSLYSYSKEVLYLSIL